MKTKEQIEDKIKDLEKGVVILTDLIGKEIESNTIHFFTNGNNEIIKLCDNGDIFVKGKLIENDKEVVDAMREFLNTQGYLNGA